MEYLPSYRDELYHSYTKPYYEDNSLMHYGVKGMRWGVRKNLSNITRSAKNYYKDYGRRAENTRKSANRYNTLAKKYDKNIVTRNLYGDYYRGVSARKNTKANHLEAKAAYVKNKTAANKKRLNKARRDRIVKNVLGPTNTVRGGYNRFRSQGDSKSKAAAKSAARAMTFGF